MLVTLRPAQIIAEVLQDCPPKKPITTGHLNETRVGLVVTLLYPASPVLYPVFPHTHIVPHALIQACLWDLIWLGTQLI